MREACEDQEHQADPDQRGQSEARVHGPQRYPRGPALVNFVPQPPLTPR